MSDGGTDRRAVLVVAAHPDDEILGCGATMASHVIAGDEVHVLIIAEGATSRNGAHSDEVSLLRKAANKAAAIVGCRPPRFGELPDNRLDRIDLLQIVKLVEKAIAEIKPQIVYTHHAGDLNVDHRIVHQSVLTACRPLPDASVRAIYSFEILSSTAWTGSNREFAFVPTLFIDATTSLARKLDALQAYESEMRLFPHARSLEAVRALSELRGALCGRAAAEAFQVEREIR